MAKREFAVVEIRLVGTRLQLRAQIAELRYQLSEDAILRGGFGVEEASTIELVARLNETRDLDYLIACPSCVHCERARTLVNLLRARMKEVSPR